jgi:hypothetical protein
MGKLYEGAVVTYHPKEYLDFLEELYALGFSRKLVVRYALKQFMDMDRTKLCHDLLSFKMEMVKKGEDSRE